MAERSKEEVLAYLNRAEVGAVGTSNLGSPRLRMMHFAADEGFDVYLTSMKGDPKITQWLNVPQTAILIHQGATFMEMEECEVIGRAEIVPAPEREKAVALLEGRSPIVAQMVRQGGLDRLEFIRVRPFTVKYRFVPEILQGEPPTVLEFPENAERASAWQDLMAKARAYRAALRPLSLTASLVSVLVGGAIAAAVTGGLNVDSFALTLLAALLVQVGTNMINDWKDAERDGDNRSALRPFSGGSRVIQLGLLSRAEMGFWGFAMCLVAAALGVYLVTVSGWGLLPLLIYGLVTGVYYSGAEGKFSFINSGAGVGELLVATTYGVGMTMGAYYVQTGSYSWQALLLSLPIALLVTCVLLINSFADADSDGRTGKLTLVVRLGKARSKDVLVGLLAFAYGIMFVLVVLGVAPLATLATLLSLPFAVQAAMYARRHHDGSAVDLAPANGYTAMTHLSFGFLLVFGLILEPLGQALPLLFLAAALGLVYWVWRYIERQRRVMEEFRLAFRGR